MSFVVYRVECEKCMLGPYACLCDRDFHDYIMSYSSTDQYLKNHPGMLVDVPRILTFACYWNLFSALSCGFANENLLDYWFADLINEIRERGGFWQAVFTVPKYVESKSRLQVFFLKSGRIPKYQPLREGN